MPELSEETSKLRWVFPASMFGEVLSTKSRQMLDLWNSLRGDAVGPPWTAIDLLSLQEHFRGITVIDVVPPPEEFVYRYVGTYEVSLRGEDPTGKTVAEKCLSGDAENVLSKYWRVVTTKNPILTANPFENFHGVRQFDVSLFLPLSKDGVEVDKVFVYSEQYEFKDAYIEKLQAAAAQSAG